ncbi:MAG: hypothetical protein ABJN84_03365 [Flavobacteriaceae bacterium]
MKQQLCPWTCFLLLLILLVVIDIKNLDGISFKNMLQNEESLPERDLFWSFNRRTTIRSGEWKLVSFIEDDKVVNQLFDLECDISEKNDLSVENSEFANKVLDKTSEWKKDIWAEVTPVSKDGIFSWILFGK